MHTPLSLKLLLILSFSLLAMVKTNSTLREQQQGYAVKNAAAATKTDTPIFDLSVSIQVVPRKVIEDQQVIRLQDALKNVSGIYQTCNNGIGELSYGLRGFDQDARYEDGFRIPFSPPQEIAHLERVEVLKGPASVLYGRIQPGGLINLVTKRPLATPYYSLQQQQLGSFDFYRTTADVTGPITNDRTLLYRFNLAYEDTGSFRDFIGIERVFVSPVVTWNLGPRTQVSLDYQYQYQDKPRDRGIPVVNGRPADVPISRFFQEPAINEGRLDHHRPGVAWSQQFTENWGLQHKFKASFHHIAETAVDGLTLQPDNRTLSRSASDFRRDEDIYFTTLDLTGKFSTWGLKHTLLLGADYYNTNAALNYVFASIPDIDIFNPIYSGMKPVFPVEPDYFLNEEWYGVYLQDQVDLRDNLHLLVGGRYDDTKLEFDGREAFGSFAEAHATDFTPRVGLVYQPLHWLALYGSYVESFGGSHAFSVSPPATPCTRKRLPNMRLALRPVFWMADSSRPSRFTNSPSRILHKPTRSTLPFQS